MREEDRFKGYFANEPHSDFIDLTLKYYKYSQLRLIGIPVNRENRLIGTNLQERNHLHRS